MSSQLPGKRHLVPINGRCHHDDRHRAAPGVPLLAAVDLGRVLAEQVDHSGPVAQDRPVLQQGLDGLLDWDRRLILDGRHSCRSDGPRPDALGKGRATVAMVAGSRKGDGTSRRVGHRKGGYDSNDPSRRQC